MRRPLIAANFVPTDQFVDLFNERFIHTAVQHDLLEDLRTIVCMGGFELVIMFEVFSPHLALLDRPLDVVSEGGNLQGLIRVVLKLQQPVERVLRMDRILWDAGSRNDCLDRFSDAINTLHYGNKPPLDARFRRSSGPQGQ